MRIIFTRPPEMSRTVFSTWNLPFYFEYDVMHSIPVLDTVEFAGLDPRGAFETEDIPQN